MPAHLTLTEELVTRIVGKVRAGVPPKTAFRSESVNEKTAWRWLKNGGERPGSIYGHFRDQLEAAIAEADVIDITIIGRAKSQPSRRVTTVTKRQARIEHGERVMVDTEITETVVEIPPDPKWAAWMLERRNPAFRATHQVEATVGEIPKDIMARTIAERLRLVQGGKGPTMLRDGDEEARQIMGSAG